MQTLQLQHKIIILRYSFYSSVIVYLLTVGVSMLLNIYEVSVPCYNKLVPRLYIFNDQLS